MRGYPEEGVGFLPLGLQQALAVCFLGRTRLCAGSGNALLLCFGIYIYAVKNQALAFCVGHCIVLLIPHVRYLYKNADYSYNLYCLPGSQNPSSRVLLTRPISRAGEEPLRRRMKERDFFARRLGNQGPQLDVLVRL